MCVFVCLCARVRVRVMPPQMRNPLEPLLLKLAREFTDSEDLTDRLYTLYQV